MQPAYIQEWNLTGEYAFTPSLGLQVGYIGEQGQHIEDYGNLNQYRVNGDPTSAPFYNSANLGLGSNIVMITEARAMMNYNALQATSPPTSQPRPRVYAELHLQQSYDQQPRHVLPEREWV